MVAVEPVKGSWWAHPLAHTIFFAPRDLADHADVLLLKLAAGKDTFVHRCLWPEIAAIALANEPWQMTRCRHRRSSFSIASTPLKPSNAKARTHVCSKPAFLCMASRCTLHRKRVETWRHWAARVRQPLDDRPPAGEARRTLREIWPSSRGPWSADEIAAARGLLVNDPHLIVDHLERQTSLVAKLGNWFVFFVRVVIRIETHHFFGQAAISVTVKVNSNESYDRRSQVLAFCQDGSLGLSSVWR
jgi:hypothetical protein